MRDVSQFDAGRPGKFRVEPQHVDCERHLVDDALAGTVAAGEKLQVAEIVVLPVSVPVMDGLLAVEFTPEVLGHHMAVLCDVPHSISREGRDRDPDVAVAFDVLLVLPVLKALQRAFHLVLDFAFVAAEFLIAVYAVARFRAASVLDLAALHAGQRVAFVGVLAAAYVRAGHRAVQRVSVELLSVCRQVALHHRERLAAFFAGEVHRRATCGRKLRLEAMFAAAFETAVAAAFVRLALVTVKRLGAVGAQHLDRHGLSPLFGNSGEYGRVVRGCQVGSLYRRLACHFPA